MKFRLPKTLLAAVMAATGLAYAGTPVQIGEQIVVGEGNTVTISSDSAKTEHYNAIAKDGKGTAVIVGNVTKYSGIFVREGELQIGDGQTETNLRIEVTDDNSSIYGIGISAAGKDAVVTFNKANYSNGGEIFNQVGGADGNGTINITNGSEINLISNSNFLVGNQIYSTSTSIAPDDTTPYAGNYANSEHNRGKGIINISGGSTLNTGYHNFWMSDGEINVDGAGTIANICNYYGNRTLLGLENDSNSTIRVTDGGTLVFNSDSLNTTSGNNASTKINADGANSVVLRPNERPPHPDTNVKGKTSTNIGTSGSNSTTEMCATNGGCISMLSDVTTVGSAKNQVTFKVDNQSTIEFNGLVINGNAGITNEGTFKVNTSLTLNSGANLTLNLTEANTGSAIITLDDSASVTLAGVSAAATSSATGDLTLNITSESNLKAGATYILFNKEVDLTGVTISGTDAEVAYENGQTVITLVQNLIVARDPLADAGIAAAWGAFNSSDAFTKTLWGPRSAGSCVEIGKNTPAEYARMAWGTVYSHSSRIGSAGADYSIYGAAVGVESKLSANRLVGVALGYDLGKAKPFTTSAVDQQTLHLGAYGRAYHRCLNSTDTIAVDWSAAYGNTTSTHDAIGGEWSQNSLQLDARATYYRAISDNTVARAFIGAQFYAQDSDTSCGVESQAIQNLRFMLGGGVSYIATPKTTVYGEVSIYGDAIRNNPATVVDGFHYTGTNPGRLGATISAGADYKVNEQWNVNAGYSLETADDRVENYLNVGATYKF